MNPSGRFSNNLLNETIEFSVPSVVATAELQATRQSDGFVVWESGFMGWPVTTSPPLPGSGTAFADFGFLASSEGVLVQIGGWANNFTDPTVASPNAGMGRCRNSFRARPGGCSVGNWQSTGGDLPDGIGNPNFLGWSGLNLVVPNAAGPLARGAMAVGTISGQQWIYLIGGVDQAGQVYPDIVRAPLLSDGTIGGSWVTDWPLPVALADAAACIFSGPDSTGAIASWLLVCGGVTAVTSPDVALPSVTPVATVYVVPLNLDGSLASQPVADTAMHNARAGHSCVVNYGRVWVFGGFKTSTTIANTEYGQLTSATPHISSWTDTGSGVGVAFHSQAAIPVPDKYNGVYAVLAGGYGASGQLTSGIQVEGIVGNGNTPGTAGVSLPQADARGGLAITFANGQTVMWYASGVSGVASISAMPIAVGPSSFGPATQGPQPAPWLHPLAGSVNPPPATGSWYSGAYPWNSPTGFGGSGELIRDESIDGQTDTIAISYGLAAGFPINDGINPGDVIVFQGRATDMSSGGVSHGGTMALVFGLAPAVNVVWSGAVSGATATGQPGLSLVYTPGVGGGPMRTWRITVTDSGSNVVADSGVQIGPCPGFSPVCNPPLQTGTYTVTATVTSSDEPYSGSSNAATISAATSVTLTPPSQPTGVNAVPDWIDGLITLAWTNGSGVAGNHVWYRLSGTTGWTLLKNLTAGPGAQSVQLMDQIALNTAYDFCVTAYNQYFAETTQSATVLNVRLAPVSTGAQGNGLPAPGGYSLMLHYAGSGPANHIALLALGGTWERQPSTNTVPTFGRPAPVGRYGSEAPFKYTGQVQFVGGTAPGASLESFLLGAQQTGTPICVRDRIGKLMYAMADTRDYDWEPGQPQTTGPWERVTGLSLLQIDYTPSP